MRLLPLAVVLLFVALLLLLLGCSSIGIPDDIARQMAGKTATDKR